MFLKTVSILRALVVGSVVILLAASASGSDGDYPSLLKRAEEMDRSLDFTELRLAYAASPDYEPYEPSDYADLLSTLRESLNANAFGDAAKHCETVLKVFYFDPKMHVLCSYANERIENDRAATMHEFAADGLFASIRGSGDGRSPETAYDVVTISEEYALIWIGGLQMAGQSLISVGGHSYDRMKVRNEETGDISVIYFRIDRITGWMSREISK